MKILVLNGSPRKQGTVATLLKAVAQGASAQQEVEWVEVYDLHMKPCLACMRCRPDHECFQAEDDAHLVGRKIKEADALIVGTPTHWGNMSSPLKLLFDRTVTAFVCEKPEGYPTARHKGKHAVIVTACTAPWPLNFILPVSRGALRAVKYVLGSGGYKILGQVVKPGTKFKPQISARLLARAETLGRKF